MLGSWHMPSKPPTDPAKELERVRGLVAGFLANWDLDHVSNPDALAAHVTQLRRAIFAPETTTQSEPSK
jgi:hypothetical protein